MESTKESHDTIPYFDVLLRALENGNKALELTFGHHAHFGYWGPNDRADGSLEDFALAAERLTVHMCDIAGVRDGQRLLDVGCGIGGTIASINTRFNGMSLTGINIDPRQIARAKSRVHAREGNTIDFVVGDACELPFPDASFDILLAVECIFHFPSRERFLAEARRVLRPGGRLCISDNIPQWYVANQLKIMNKLMGSYLARAIGRMDNTCTAGRYHDLARAAGLTIVHEEDATRNVMPTYSAMRTLIPEMGVRPWVGHACIASMEMGARMRSMRYMFFAFDTPGSSKP